MATLGATRFYFDSFTLDIAGGRILYRYSTDAGHAFEHALTFAFPEGASEGALRPAAFALGMAELAHFWKAFLTPTIIVRAGMLDPEQVQFWEILYTKGLGEFFYVNEVDFRGLVHIEIEEGAPIIRPSVKTLPTRALVPFGGGKDSLVTGELLKKQGKEFSWFELEPLPFSEKLREASGTVASLQMGRSVADNFGPIVELVKQGAPNGHVPITATYMMSAVLAAEAHGFSDVILSLERSASEGNVEYLGEIINHQYSKSFEFELMAAAYIAGYVNPQMKLFSLVRPLYELQVVEEFVKHPIYFPRFVSCNRGLKTGTWCGECAKCAFMFAALSAFLPPETVEGIFKKNLFEDAALVPVFEELVGLHEVKPFDCVGTFEENMLALYLSGEKYKEAGRPMPLVLAGLPIERGAVSVALLTARGEHQIPAGYDIP